MDVMDVETTFCASWVTCTSLGENFIDAYILLEVCHVIPCGLRQIRFCCFTVPTEPQIWKIEIKIELILWFYVFVAVKLLMFYRPNQPFWATWLEQQIKSASADHNLHIKFFRLLWEKELIFHLSPSKFWASSGLVTSRFCFALVFA